VIATRGAGSIVAAKPRQEPAGDAVCVAIRPEKVKLSRRGPVEAAIKAGAINHLDGIVSGLGYLGGSTRYTVTLEGGMMFTSALANTARVEIDEFSAGEHVVAWFEPDDCVVLEP
jgi:putrescine transport system ATP-binding protein